MTITDMALRADAYGSELELGDAQLRIIAKGRVGRVALGTEERIIQLGDVTALRFDKAGRMKNGSLTIVDGRGKTEIHVRHKQNAEVEALYDAIREKIGPVSDSTEGARRFSEDLQAWQEEFLAKHGPKAES